MKDINPGAGSSAPFGLVHINGTVYFTASEPLSGSELWKSDGTAAGTTLVSDINPGAGSSDPVFLVNMNGTLFFRATEPVHGGRAL